MDHILPTDSFFKELPQWTGLKEMAMDNFKVNIWLDGLRKITESLIRITSLCAMIQES
jgi:hypothetical protein